MTEQHRRDKGTLLLAFIVGLSVHGTFSALLIPQSIFRFFRFWHCALRSIVSISVTSTRCCRKACRNW